MFVRRRIDFTSFGEDAVRPPLCMPEEGFGGLSEGFRGEVSVDGYLKQWVACGCSVMQMGCDQEK